MEKELVAALGKETGQTMAPASFLVGSYAALKRDLEALQKSMATDALKQKQFAEMTRVIATLEETKSKLEQEIKTDAAADNRMKDARDRRVGLYRCIFVELADEEKILEDLYAPLHNWLKGESDAERKLEFYVRRRVNIEAWAAKGEALLDLRKRGPLNEKGALVKLAKKYLLAPWQRGDLDVVEAGMEAFVDELGDWKNLLTPTASATAFGDWLFSTDHIDITYGIRYGGTEIDKLSPGTKGIVLLILYLAIDEEDDSPLIVDQPEENLDPQSVFAELVRYFRRSRNRRQVIVVTHNPNLVVNTDADQVIIARSEKVAGETLPHIHYDAGPLELAAVRTATCLILEGGEEAFRRRERRYELSS